MPVYDFLQVTTKIKAMTQLMQDTYGKFRSQVHCELPGPGELRMFTKAAKRTITNLPKNWLKRAEKELKGEPVEGLFWKTAEVIDLWLESKCKSAYLS